MTAPKTCTEAEVPLAMANWTLDPWQEPSIQSRYPSWSAPSIATSGRNREFADGMPATPACHGGFEKSVLCPPPLDHRPTITQFALSAVQLSFQAFSGI